MKVWLVGILIFTVTDIGRIAKTYQLIKEAEYAYLEQNYPLAIEKYKLLVDSLNYEDDKATLNLANAYYRNNQKEESLEYYRRILDSKDKVVKTAANQQMGVLAYEKKEMAQAMNYFKTSLISDPSNDEARYNYELLKKINQQQQNQDQQNQPQEPPTEFAKNAKARSEILVSQGRYKEAYELMQSALKADETVRNFQDFIKRTGEIAQIDETN